jgi:ATP-dependent Lon protease
LDSIKELAIQIITESPNIPSEATLQLKNIESQSFLINFVTSNMNLSVKEKQDLLKINNLKDRALETLRFMNIELQKLELKMIFSPKCFDLEKATRIFLQQQMKTIQEELGGVSRGRNGRDACKIKTKKWDEKTQKFRKRIVKMRMNHKLLILGFKEIIWSFY